MKTLTLLLFTLAIGCTKNQGVSMIGATQEQTAIMQDALDQLRIQTRGAIDRYISNDGDLEVSFVYGYPEGGPQYECETGDTDRCVYPMVHATCAWTEYSDSTMRVFPCGYRQGDNILLGTFLHEMIHASGVHDHIGVHNTALMSPTMDHYPTADAPFCIHDLDALLICSQLKSCVPSRMATCPDTASDPDKDW